MFKMEAHPSEVMIVRAIARTWGAAQFGCSPNSSVFTADTDGYAWPDGGHRNPITGLSPLLDAVSGHLQQRLAKKWHRWSLL